AVFGYYEYYSDQTWGYANDNENTLSQAADGKVVLLEGYYLDFLLPAAAQQKYEVIIGDDLHLKNSDLQWTDQAGTYNAKPLKIKIKNQDSGEMKDGYRLFLNNEVLDKNQAGKSVKTAPEKVEFLINGVDMLNQSQETVYFNSLFANCRTKSDARPSSFLIRSPRHLDNVDQLPVLQYLQEIDLDFKLYRLELTVQDGAVLPIDKAKMPVDPAVFFGFFQGKFVGNNSYIKGVTCRISATDQNNLEGMGLFSQISGSVSKIALIDSSFQGDRLSIGSIAGLVDGGKLENCQVSHVKVMGTKSGTQYIGGIVGRNASDGTVENVYFNHSYREKGVFTSPVQATDLSNKFMGGLIGNQQGKFNNAYTTAVGPKSKSGA
ncbi:MAG: hypothetical protein RR396_06900, partial [Clostridiales bacterium]